jgi:hypothetical protein
MEIVYHKTPGNASIFFGGLPLGAMIDNPFHHAGSVPLCEADHINGSVRNGKSTSEEVLFAWS